MAETPPVVYLLHGEDETAIAQYVSSILARLGDSLIAEMNTTRLDGRVVTLEEVETASFTLPFMTKRRVVILSHPLARLNTPESHKKFTGMLDRVPPTTALILVEHKTLTEDKERRKKNIHWLEKWALEGGDRTLLKPFPPPQGQELVRRIREMAKNAGGQISPQAASQLALLVGENMLALELEVQKLVAYANFSHRVVEPEDVEHLTADLSQGDIFKMVDALGNRDQRGALSMLQRLLEDQDPRWVFTMVVRQFRMILLMREVIEGRGQAGEVARLLKIPTFVTDKVAAQAQKFSLPRLVEIYHGLVELDEGMKSSEIEDPLALEILITEIAQ